MQARVIYSRHPDIDAGDLGNLKLIFPADDGCEVEFTKEFWHSPSQKRITETRSIWFKLNEVEIITNAETSVPTPDRVARIEGIPDQQC